MGSFDQNGSENGSPNLGKTRVFNIPAIPSHRRTVSGNLHNFASQNRSLENNAFENNRLDNFKNGGQQKRNLPKNSNKKGISFSNNGIRESNEIQQKDHFPILEKEFVKRFGKEQSSKSKFQNKFFARPATGKNNSHS